MTELSRQIVARLRRFIGNRRKLKRVRTRLTFSLALADPRLSQNGFRKLPRLSGHTLDLSRTGIALIVPAIRIGEHYLAGNDRKLQVKLELPSGPVEMNVIPVRYESLEEHEEEDGYLIGARISEMNEVDRSRFDAYIAALLSNPVARSKSNKD